MERIEFSSSYTKQFIETLNNILCLNNGNPCTFDEGISLAVEEVVKTKLANKKIIISGNGGSASIGSHLSTDFSKNGEIRSMCFSDPSLLTCLSNDFSYKEAFSKALSIYGDHNDLLIAISSSGNSENISELVKQAETQGIRVITFSGFDENNTLKGMGHLHFYVPTKSYGFAETIHSLIIHQVLYTYLRCEKKIDIFNKNKPL